MTKNMLSAEELDETLARDTYWVEHFDELHPRCQYCYVLLCAETADERLCHGYIEEKDRHPLACSCG
jgi:hypothetical protein